MSSLDHELSQELAGLREAGLERVLRRIEAPQGCQVEADGRALVNFSSNDYLGLAGHPALRESAARAAREWGAGSGASRLICGSLGIHHELEEALAAFKGTAAALTFSTGYATAVGTITALAGTDDLIILDKLVHACCVDGARLSGATLRIHRHNDLEDLEAKLKWAADRRAEGRCRRVLVITESVFSMDGDLAPLRNIVELKERYGAWLMVDEAHATGLYGEHRRGLVEEFQVADQVEVQMGTLGKALGAGGGYIAGSRPLIDLLIHRARSFLFSTAPVPAQSAAARAAVELVQSGEGETLRQRCWANVDAVKNRVIQAGWSLPPARSAILPLAIGDETRALATSTALREQGLLVPAIRYPTVARGEARLRLTVTAAHSPEDIAALAEGLAQGTDRGQNTVTNTPSTQSESSTAAGLDHRHVWHPFTQMQDWLREEPIVIESGRGAVLRDARGRAYLDANASIWTNLHGHRHPKLDAALRRQLGKIAHSSALGLANVPSSHLAARLVAAARPTATVTKTAATETARANPPPAAALQKVFFSDDGLTALEVALKLAYEFTRRQRGPKSRPRFLSLAGAYHGDTVGAVSVGHIDLFHRAYAGLLFKSDRVMAPYCYRCPFNRARPERADARSYRQCHWECVTPVEQALGAQQKRRDEPYAGFVFEPRMQGAAGMIAQPEGWIPRVTALARSSGALLIADEVMTGFGRTGGTEIFATTDEGVTPDFLCVAKGLTGGYLPMGATLTTPAVFDAFLGEYGDFKTFFHGHSYTGNQLGAAVAMASLDVLQSAASRAARRRLEQVLRKELAELWAQPAVGDIRQVGLVAGIELVRKWQTRTPFDARERVGQRVCAAMARRGVLTRPIGNVIVLMPPYCSTPAQVRRMVGALKEALTEVLGS